MLTHFGLDSISAGWPESTVCIGVFDGVHLGHQAVISEAVRRAKVADRPSIVVTFDRHPMAVLAPEKKPKMVLAPQASIAKIATLGVDICAVAAFDLELSTMSAEHFLSEYLVKKLGAVELVVGHDFAFGHKRMGTPEWLANRISTFVHPPLELGGLRVSSSAIRNAIAEGNFVKAHEMLASDYELVGVVEKGQGLGTKLGVATANLRPLYDQVLPVAGIYAGRATLDGRSYSAAISLGWRPSIPGAGFAIEAHLLDYTGENLYGKVVSVGFVSRLRDELSFETVEQLTQQMEADIEDTRKVLKNYG